MQSQPLNIKRANIYGVISNTGSVVRNNWKNFITWLFITFISLQSWKIVGKWKTFDRDIYEL